MFNVIDLEYIETLPTGTVEPSAVLQAEVMQEDYEYEESIKQALADELQRLLKQDQECTPFATLYVMSQTGHATDMTSCQIETELEILRDDMMNLDLTLPDSSSVISFVNAAIHVIDSLLSVIDSTKEG